MLNTNRIRKIEFLAADALRRGLSSMPVVASTIGELPETMAELDKAAGSGSVASETRT